MEIVPTQAGASKFRQKVLEVIRKMGKKSVNNLYKPMLEHGNVEKKFHTAARGKSNRPDVAAILNPDNIQTHVNVVIEQLSNTAPEGYDWQRWQQREDMQYILS